MDKNIIDDEFSTILLYIAGFGFSEIIIEYFKINSYLSRIIYFSTIIFISLALTV